MKRNYDSFTCFSQHRGQVKEMTKICTPSQTDVIFAVMDALVRIYEDDLMATKNVTDSSANRFAKMTRMTNIQVVGC